jgi:orotate phosphoribosyltransferase
MSYKISVAQALLSINAIKYVGDKPIKFKSGILSPVYVDNRTIPYHPIAWKQIIDGFQSAITEQNIPFDIIAGVAVGGVPHSSALAYATSTPSVFVRTEAKQHGTSQLVEGGDVNGKTVLLVEDLITTGGSSLKGVAGLRNAGATVNHLLAIVGYGFDVADEAFRSDHVDFATLTTFETILTLGVETNYFTSEQADTIRTWQQSPYTWGIES